MENECKWTCFLKTFIQTRSEPAVAWQWALTERRAPWWHPAVAVRWSLPARVSSGSITASRAPLGSRKGLGASAFSSVRWGQKWQMVLSLWRRDALEECVTVLCVCVCVYIQHVHCRKAIEGSVRCCHPYTTAEVLSLLHLSEPDRTSQLLLSSEQMQCSGKRVEFGSR